MEIKIRECTMKDLFTLQEIAYQTFDETFAPLNDPANMNAYLQKAFNPQQLKKELLNSASTFFFLYLNDQLAGYLKINLENAQTESIASPSLEIERIYIKKEHQGNGLGKMLIDKAVEIAEKTGKSSVWLGVWEKNFGAIEFYKKMGFVIDGTHSFYMGDDEQSDFIMKKTLG